MGGACGLGTDGWEGHVAYALRDGRGLWPGHWGMGGACGLDNEVGSSMCMGIMKKCDTWPIFGVITLELFGTSSLNPAVYEYDLMFKEKKMASLSLTKARVVCAWVCSVVMATLCNR